MVAEVKFLSQNPGCWTKWQILIAGLHNVQKPADRLLVQQQVQHLFRAPLEPSCSSDSVEVDQIDDKSLDAFNGYIQGPLRSVVMENVGARLHVPYGLCLLAGLPMTFYSGVDILQCDEACVASNGFEAFSSYMKASMVTWLVKHLACLPHLLPSSRHQKFQKNV